MVGNGWGGVKVGKVLVWMGKVGLFRPLTTN